MSLSSSQLIKLIELSWESDSTWLSWIDLSQLNSILKLNLSWVKQLKLNNRSSNDVSFVQKHLWFNFIIDFLSMLVSLIHHLLSCFDQSFASKD